MLQLRSDTNDPTMRFSHYLESSKSVLTFVYDLHSRPEVTRSYVLFTKMATIPKFEVTYKKFLTKLASIIHLVEFKVTPMIKFLVNSTSCSPAFQIWCMVSERSNTGGVGCKHRQT
jgi:hypothetical protein